MQQIQTESPQQQLAGKLVKSREELHMTQKDLGTKSGINQADISRIERGIANPSLDTISRIAEAMHKKIVIDFVDDPSYVDGCIYSGPLAQYLPEGKAQGEYVVSDIIMARENGPAELIEGFVYDAVAPDFVRQDILSAVHRMVSDYDEANGNMGRTFMNSIAFVDKITNDGTSYVIPDVGYVSHNEYVFEDKFITAGADFVCEVVNFADKDQYYNQRMRFYRDFGVKEYWILDVDCKKLTVYKSENRFRTPHVYENSEIVGIGVFEDKLTINLKGLWRFAEL